MRVAIVKFSGLGLTNYDQACEELQARLDDTFLPLDFGPDIKRLIVSLVCMKNPALHKERALRITTHHKPLKAHGVMYDPSFTAERRFVLNYDFFSKASVDECLTEILRKIYAVAQDLEKAAVKKKLDFNASLLISMVDNMLKSY